MNENLKVKTETIIRTVVLAITMVNSVLTMMGKNPMPFAEDQIYQVLSGIVTVAATAWAWWKNNSFTQNALKADEYLKTAKEEEYKDKIGGQYPMD